jgi:hypothetical protein
MLRIFNLIAIALVLGVGVADAEPVFPPGLRIGLEPAPGLAGRPGLSGFEDTKRKASVRIVELPTASYGQLVSNLFGAAPPGAKNVTRELFSFQDGVGYLYDAHIVENGTVERRWFLLTMPLTDGAPFVAVVDVRIPDTARSAYSEAAVKKMLASIAIRKPPIEEQLGLIPFKLQDLAGFKVKSVAPDTVFIADGSSEDASTHPYMVVSIGSASTTEMDDHGRFSRDLLAHTPLRGLTIQSAEDMRIGGTPGFEIRGRVQGPGNSELSIVQWVRFLGGGFIRIVGIVPREQWDEAFNRFRTVRDGVAMR